MQIWGRGTTQREARRQGPGCRQQPEAPAPCPKERDHPKSAHSTTPLCPRFHPYFSVPQDYLLQSPPCQLWVRTTASCLLLDSLEVGSPCPWDRLPKLGPLQKRSGQSSDQPRLTHTVQVLGHTIHPVSVSRPEPHTCSSTRRTSASVCSELSWPSRSSADSRWATKLVTRLPS